MDGKKSIVGLFIGVVLLLGGTFSAKVLDDSITVSMQSDICPSATLKVTKDDWTLKCGSRIAFKADTILEYYKTYGTDEWVRDFRYVGFNKKEITLYLEDNGDSFDIFKITKFRKGRQYVGDGILTEIFTFTKDKLKISYDFEPYNKANHRISMRVKKQYNSYLDISDVFGHTAIQTGNLVYYEGVGNLKIDPTITLTAPTSGNTTHYEGQTVSFICSSVGDGNFSNPSGYNQENVTFYWSANGTWLQNGTTAISGSPFNATVSHTRVIPHQDSADDGYTNNFTWNCYFCAVNGSGTANCSWGTNSSVVPYYKPNTISISSPSNDDNLNVLNYTGWGMCSEAAYSKYCQATDGQGLWINWSYPGLSDNRNITWNVSYYGVTTSTRLYGNLVYTTANTTEAALFNASHLAVDDYFVTIQACNTEALASGISLCVTDTMNVSIEVFDYTLRFSHPSINKIRFSPQPTYTNGPAIGQQLETGIIALDFHGNSYPTGEINITLNYSNTDTSCITLTANDENNVSSGVSLTNNTKVVVSNTASSATQYIWLWATKTSCSTTTSDFELSAEVLN